MKTCSHLWQYFAELFLEWEMFEIKIVEIIKTRILRSVTFFWNPRRLWDTVEKHGGTTEAADGNMAVRCMLD